MTASEGARLAMLREALERGAKVLETTASEVTVGCIMPAHEYSNVAGVLRRALTATEADVTAFLEGVRREALEEALAIAKEVHDGAESDDCCYHAIRSALLERVESLGAARPPLGDPK